MTQTSAPTVLVLGDDLPLALPRAAGLAAERVPAAELAERLGSPNVVAAMISHFGAEQARLYHRLRQAGAPVPLVFVDLPAGDDDPAERYAERRLRAAAARLTALGHGRIDDADLANRLRAEWGEEAAESSPAARAAAPGTGPAAILLGASGPAQAGHDAGRGYEVRWVEGAGGYGAPTGVEQALAAGPWRAMAIVHRRRVATHSRASLGRRAEAALTQAARVGATHLVWGGADPLSDADAWFLSVLRRMGGGRYELAAPAAAGPPSGTKDRPAAGAPRSARPRARKLLTVANAFSAYQREWFAGIRARAAAGEPFAVVNADAPQEILRALDVPFVVNQWWASIAAAKGGTERAHAALREAGLPDRHEGYNSQGIADFLAGEEGAPWGGLPRPQLLEAVRGEDALAGLFEEWSRLTGAELILFDRTVESREEFPLDWWEAMPERWDEMLEPERLDLMTEQIAAAIPRIERATGRELDPARLREVLDLVNEQEEWYRRTRNLIARTAPAPVGIVDTIPATMIPQWHRGTEWGRDAARAFHDEVAARVEAGEAACPGERLRVMWVGRGLWQHMWLYQAFEESHGAVFVWSMYLGLAADGYLRYLREGQDPLRSLSARFVTVGDELRMPAWAAAWHLAEAERHGIDAVVAVDDAEPAVLEALERAGYPVLRLGIDNLAGDVDAVAEAIAAFLDGVPGR